MRVLVTKQAPERGAVAVVTALLLVPFLLIGAFVLDLGSAYAQARAFSSGSDSAALAILNEAKAEGAKVNAQTCDAYRSAFLAKYPTTADIKTLAAQYLTANASFGRTVSSSEVPTATITCINNTSNLVADVGVHVSVPTSLGRVIGVNSIDVGRNAQAVLGVGGKADCGLCVLGTGVHDTQNGDINVTGGNVALNGSGTSGPKGVVVSGGQITIEQGYSPGQEPWTPTPIIGPTAADPLAGLTMPPNITGLQPKSDICADGPGVYAALDPSSAKTDCVLSAGMYVIVGGSKIQGQQNIVGTGVTLYFTCGTVSTPTPCTSSSAIYDESWTGQGALTLTAPATGCTPSPACGIPGMAVLADREYRGTLSLGGNAGANITGTVYAKDATVAFNGGGSSSSTAWNLNSLVIVQDFVFAGTNTALNITYDADQNIKVPPTDSRLTQ